MKIRYIGPSRRALWEEVLSPILRDRPDKKHIRHVNIYFDILPHQLAALRLRRALRPLVLRNPASLNNVDVDVLIRLEPRIIIPYTFSLRHGDFDFVLDTGFRNGSPIPQPQLPETLELQPIDRPRSESEFCMIAANKFSPVRGELYTLRKQIALELDNVKLFGRDWQIGISKKILICLKSLAFCALDPKIMQLESLGLWLAPNPSSHGEVEDKASVYSNFNYAIVVENEANYVSEKIYDALSSGCIPIYVGPRVVELNWAEHLMVRAKPSLSSISEAMSVAQKIDPTEWRKKLRKAHSDWDSASHEFGFVMVDIAEKISEFLALKFEC